MDLSNLAYSLLCVLLCIMIYIVSIYPNQNYCNRQIQKLMLIWNLTAFAWCINFFTCTIFDLRKIKRISKLHYLISSISGIVISLLYYISSSDVFIYVFYFQISIYTALLVRILYKYIIKNRNYRNRKEKIVMLGLVFFAVFTLVFFIAKYFIHDLSYQLFRILFVSLAVIFSYALSVGFNDEHESLVKLKNNLSEEVKQQTAELRKANIKLKSLDRLKDIFIANVSHELRTPLTSIRAPIDAIYKNKYGSVINAESDLFRMILNNTENY